LEACNYARDLMSLVIFHPNINILEKRIVGKDLRVLSISLMCVLITGTNLQPSRRMNETLVTCGVPI